MIKRSSRARPVPADRMDTIIKTRRSASRPAVSRRLVRSFSYLLIFAGVLGVIAAAIFAYAQVRFRSNGKQIPSLESKVPSQPMNVLLLGSDTREGLSKEEQKSFGPPEGKRADTIILLHLDEKLKKAVLLQFPRDLRVTGPDGSVGKINGIYAKGPDAMVQEIKQLTGLPIHHYVEVNFKGFNKIIDTLGGVRVFFERPIKDAKSGLDVPRGCVEVKGPQALAFVRVRNIDDDFGRIARQQLFVKLMMDKILTAGTLLNPAKVVKLVNLFAENVTHDADLTVGDARRIAFRLRGFDSGKVDMRVVPSSGARIHRVSYVVANKAESDELFAALRNRRPLPPFGRTGVSSIEPAEVRVTVLNGTSVDKLAQGQAAALAVKGFQVAGTGGGPAHSQTTVYYKPGYEEQANLVAGQYGAPVKPMPSSVQAQSEVAVVLGRNFTSPPGPSQRPGSSPKTPPAAAKPLVHPCAQ